MYVHALLALTRKVATYVGTIADGRTDVACLKIHHYGTVYYILTRPLKTSGQRVRQLILSGEVISSLHFRYRYPCLRSAGMGDAWTISRKSRHGLVSWYSPLRHGLRRHSLRDGRANNASKDHIQTPRQSRGPRSYPEMSLHSSRIPDQAGGDSNASLDVDD